MLDSLIIIWVIILAEQDEVIENFKKSDYLIVIKTDTLFSKKRIKEWKHRMSCVKQTSFE